MASYEQTFGLTTDGPCNGSKVDAVSQLLPNYTAPATFGLLAYRPTPVAYLPLGHLGHAPDRKCSKLKISHAAVIAAGW